MRGSICHIASHHNDMGILLLYFFYQKFIVSAIKHSMEIGKLSNPKPGKFLWNLPGINLIINRLEQMSSFLNRMSSSLSLFITVQGGFFLPHNPIGRKSMASLFCSHLHKIFLSPLYNLSLSGKVFLCVGCLNIFNRISIYGHTALFHIPSGF